MKFPFPLGDGVFDGQTRQESAEFMLSRFMGKGGFGESEDLVIARTRQSIARGMASASLACDRLLEQIFPADSHPDDLLPDWEQHLRVVRQPPDITETRQAAVGKKIYNFSGKRNGIGEGSGRGIDIKQYIEEIVGVGNCTYRFNTAKFLSDNGFDPRGIFAIAFEVPLSEIQTVGQIAKLKAIAEEHKPAHVGLAITRAVARGFLADDAPQSLVDRDVVRI